MVLCRTPINSWAGKSETLIWVAEIIVASLLSLSDKACLQEASRWNFWCSGFRFIPGSNSDWDLNIWTVILPKNKDYISNCVNKIQSWYEVFFLFFLWVLGSLPGVSGILQVNKLKTIMVFKHTNLTLRNVSERERRKGRHYIVKQSLLSDLRGPWGQHFSHDDLQ